VSGSTDLEVRTSRHLFLLQSELADQLRAWIDERASQDDWPVLVTSIARKWLDEGLDDRGITRDLDWGVPVDRPGFEDKVFYVWFDAPIAYIGATKEWADLSAAGADDGSPARDWKSWWYDADDVRYTQFLAKDNVPFHTISFPATLVGSGEPWKRADYIKGFNWLNYYGGKFSTSQSVGVFTDDALDLLPADLWRWYLVANAPESDDTSFTWERFAATVNSDLVGNLGNFVNRTLTFTSRRFGETVPDGGTPGPVEAALATDLATAAASYATQLEALQFRKAAAALRAVWDLGNAYLERTRPWIAIRTDPDQAACSLRTAVNLIPTFARLAAPIIPTTSTTILDALGLPPATTWPSPDLTELGPGHPFTLPPVLFPKITPDDITEWSARFKAP
jgi:methionyl-tRNA synthetase